MSASTAGEKYNVYSSIGYLNEKGYVISSDFERYTGRFNANYNITKWLTTGMTLAGSMQESNFLAQASGGYYANPFSQTRYMAPVYPVYLHNTNGSYDLDADGNKQYDITSSYLSNRNIVYELNNNKSFRKRNTLNGSLFATFKLPYNFEFTIRGSLARNNTATEIYENPVVGDGASNNGRFTSINSNHRSYTGQQLLSWGRDFDKHHVDVLLGHENYNTDSVYSYVMNTDMGVDGLLVLSNFTTNSTTEGFSRKYRTESWLARVRYNFGDKYYADASFRRDGSSRFYKDNRWGNFFSIGANWHITAEDFMKPCTWVDELKLRASYGEVGNDASIGYYGYMALYDLLKNAGTTALLKSSLEANDLKWETTQTIDIALEGRLFDRLSFSVGYFDKRSKDLLFAVSLPLSAGSYPYDSSNKNLTINQNIGTVSNRGWELSFDYDAIRNRDWKWTVGLDATFLSNKIIKLPGGTDINNGTIRRFSEGHSIYEYYTYHFEGVDQMTGRSLYTIDPDQVSDASSAGDLVTINDVNYTTNTSYAIRQWAGSALPDVYGSLRSVLKWKNFTFNTLFTYSLGGKVYDGAYQSLMSTSSASVSALHEDILNSWSSVPTGMTETSANRIDPNGTPLIDHYLSQYNNATSDRWLVSGSYFTVKNVNLSYELPASLFRNSGIEGVRVTAGIENLATITAREGLNPQQSYNGSTYDSFSAARVYNLGIVVNF